MQCQTFNLLKQRQYGGTMNGGKYYGVSKLQETLEIEDSLLQLTAHKTLILTETLHKTRQL